MIPHLRGDYAYTSVRCSLYTLHATQEQREIRTGSSTQCKAQGENDRQVPSTMTKLHGAFARHVHRNAIDPVAKSSSAGECFVLLAICKSSRRTYGVCREASGHGAPISERDVHTG